MGFYRWVILRYDEGLKHHLWGCERCKTVVSIIKPQWAYCPYCGSPMLKG